MGIYVKVTLLAALLFLPSCAKNAGDGATASTPSSSTRPLEENILGDWTGALTDGSWIELSFTNDLVVVTLNKKGGEVSTSTMKYEVDSTKKEIKINAGEAEPAIVKPRKDGAFNLSGDLKIGATSFSVMRVYLERAKPGTLKKVPPKSTGSKTDGTPPKSGSKAEPSESKGRSTRSDKTKGESTKTKSNG